MLHLRSAKDVANMDKRIFTKKNIFTLVYMSGCPWCVNMMDEWNTLAKDPPKDTLLIMIDLSLLKELTVALSAKDNRNRLGHVRTVPALDLHRKTRRRVHFEGERTANEMRSFVEKKLS